MKPMYPTPDRGPFEQALALAGPKAGEAVLDLSGRAGTIALKVALKAASVEAVQPDEELTEEGRRLATALGMDNVFFHAGPLHRLPFDAGQFNLVLWLLGVSQAPRPLATLQEIARVLGTSGRLVLQDITAFGAPFLDLKLWEMERQRNPRHLLFYGAGELAALLELAGFRVEHTQSTVLTQDFDYWLDPLELDRDDRSRIKQSFFRMSPEEQDLIDLSLDDKSISFSQRVFTLRAVPRRV